MLAIFLIGVFAIWRIVNSPFGMILRSIRENENRAISLGYSVGRYKLAAFVMSAALAGLAGATKAIVFQFATLTDVTWQMSGEVILMNLLGGIGTMVGPVVGAGLVVGLENTLGHLGLPGDHRHRSDLHGLRARLPPRHRRRDLRALAGADGRRRRALTDPEIDDIVAFLQRLTDAGTGAVRMGQNRDKTSISWLPPMTEMGGKANGRFRGAAQESRRAVRSLLCLSLAVGGLAA